MNLRSLCFGEEMCTYHENYIMVAPTVYSVVTVHGYTVTTNRRLQPDSFVCSLVSNAVSAVFRALDNYSR